LKYRTTIAFLSTTCPSIAQLQYRRINSWFIGGWAHLLSQPVASLVAKAISWHWQMLKREAAAWKYLAV